MTEDDMKLMDQLVATAGRISDGHLTVMKFTTNWRVTFETIEWDPDLIAFRDAYHKMACGKTFAEAARNALVRVTP